MEFDAADASTTLTVTPMPIDASALAVTQQSLNVNKQGAVTFALSLGVHVVDGQTVAQLFDGATCTLSMRTSATDSTYEGLQVACTATVVDGVVHATLNLKDNSAAHDFFAQGLDAGETSAGKANWECITLSVLSGDGNYSISDDVLMRIFGAGK